jgi:hypothetical protein
VCECLAQRCNLLRAHSASLYGEDEDARIPSAYGTEDVEGVTADKQYGVAREAEWTTLLLT